MRYRIEVYDNHNGNVGKFIRSVTVNGLGDVILYMHKRGARRVQHDIYDFVTKRRAYIIFNELE